MPASAKARKMGAEHRLPVVLADSAPITPLLIERQKGQTQLFVKEVKVQGRRYIVCRNEAEAEHNGKDWLVSSTPPRP
jgi:hypothetical protein